MDSTKYWIGFTLIHGIGPQKVRRLVDYFGDLERAWRSPMDDLLRAGLDTKSAEALIAKRREIDLDRQIQAVERQGIDVITWEDDRYPRRLLHIYAPPPVLYVRGSIEPGDEWAIAVVGTRRATIYGRQVAERLAGELAANGVTVVSGLARGIDSCAHKAALEAGGRTIAVLGSGVDVIYPAENAKLASAVLENGAMLSEYPLGTGPDAVNFPARNRIISGLSLGTLVVEAGVTSGALITADFALEQGRDVFAVPGRIFDRTSQGTNRLIQQGAKLVSGVQDVLQELNLTMIPQQLEMRQLLPENRTEEILLSLLSGEPAHIDEIGRNAGLPIAEVSSALAMMELKGMVKQLGGMNYVLARA
ncbi:MAG: DNA-protecting protein DprA [Chloroflexi bacterium]|nr:DNA-protecting protein DprA [Chloroflexota bacterium]